MDRDRQLMIEVQAGRQDSFAELVDRFRPRLFRFAYSSLREIQVSEDVVQETFLAIFQSRHTYNPTFAVSTWIWTILLNLVRRTRQRRAQRISCEVQSHRHERVSTIDSTSEHREQLDCWLMQIPDAEADALRLRFFGELSFEQIAASMHSSVSGAKLRVRNGLNRLSELARQETETPTVGVSSGENP